MPTRRRFETLPLFEPSGAIQSATEPRRLSRGLSITSGDCSLRQGMPDMCFWTSIGHQNRILDSFDSQRKLGISKLTLSPKLIRFPSPQVPHRSFRPKHRILGQRNHHCTVLRAGRSMVLIPSSRPPEPSTLCATSAEHPAVLCMLSTMGTCAYVCKGNVPREMQQ